jgi:hypothetical protein
MGATGATASAEAADTVIVIDRLAVALHISRRAPRIARQSVLAGMGVSLAAMAAAFAGPPPRWLSDDPAVARRLLETVAEEHAATRMTRAQQNRGESDAGDGSTLPAEPALGMPLRSEDDDEQQDHPHDGGAREQHHAEAEVLEQVRQVGVAAHRRLGQVVGGGEHRGLLGPGT